MGIAIYTIEELVTLALKHSWETGKTLTELLAPVLGTVTTALYSFIIGIIVCFIGYVLHCHWRQRPNIS